LDFLTSFELQHIQIFFQLVLQNFQSVLLECSKPQDLITTHISIPPKQQLGFLNMLSTILDVLSSKIESRAQDFVKILLYLLCRTVNADATEQNPDLAPYASDIRNLSLRRLAKIVELYPNTLSAPYADALFAIIEQVVQKLSREHTYQRSGLLEFIFALSKHWELAVLLKRSPTIMFNILQMLSASISPNVLIDILEFMSTIVSMQSLHSTEEHVLTENDLSTLLSSLEGLLDRYSLCFLTNPSSSNSFPPDVLKTELYLLSLVSQYIKDETQAYKMLNLLIPLLKYSHESKGH
jgi:hypothetical protein